MGGSIALGQPLRRDRSTDHPDPRQRASGGATANSAFSRCAQQEAWGSRWSSNAPDLSGPNPPSPRLPGPPSRAPARTSRRRSASAEPLPVRLRPEVERRDGNGHAALVDRHEGEVAGIRVPPCAGQEVFRLHADADLHRGPAHIVHLGGAGHEFARVHRPRGSRPARSRRSRQDARRGASTATAAARSTIERTTPPKTFPRLFTCCGMRSSGDEGPGRRGRTRRQRRTHAGSSAPGDGDGKRTGGVGMRRAAPGRLRRFIRGRAGGQP